MENTDSRVVEHFSREWSKFDQSSLDQDELKTLFDNYFSLFPWDKLPDKAVGFDAGCGSGRWAKFVAPRVGTLHLIDPSAQALNIAMENVGFAENCVFHNSSVGKLPLDPESCDFGYCLGVLHHIPNTFQGLKECVSKLKPGAPFLLYLYYRFDNRPAWFSAIWKMSDILRRLISKMPFFIRHVISDVLAATVYFPLATLSKLTKNKHFPLSQYQNSSFYVMRNDALDRFGTSLEKRFTKAEMTEMMESAGLENITFNDNVFWTAVGYKVKV